jgi:hypothetical protein
MLLSLNNAAKGESVLHTIGFILCAYGIYALCKAWNRRHRRRITPYRQWQRRRRLTLVGGTGVGVGIIILIAILGLPSQYENLKSASIISTSWGHDAWKPGQEVPRQEVLPIKTQSVAGQPVYAYLHPESPPAQLLGNDKSSSSRNDKFHRLGKNVHRGKAPKTISRVTHKKERGSAKLRTKNLKTKKKKQQLPKRDLAAIPR